MWMLTHTTTYKGGVSFLTNYVLGCDNIDGKEHSYLNTVSKALKDKGHSVKSVGVGPNVVQSYALGSGSKGTICIQIAGGLDGWTAADMVTGLKQGYYHCDYMMIAGTSAFTGNSNLAKSAYTEKHMKRASDAGATLQGMYNGKTPKQFNEEYKKYFKFCLGDSIEEMIKQILDEADDSSDEKSEGSSSSTYADMVKDLVKPWDKSVEIRNNGIRVLHIDRIPAPNPRLWIKEGVNLVSDSLTVTTYRPETVNKYSVNYDGKSITLSDESLIDRYGEVDQVEDAKFIKNMWSRVEDFTYENKSPFEWESRAISKGLVTGVGDKGKYSTRLKAQDKITCTSEEVDIKDPEEAKDFALQRWGAWRRDSGFTVECKVIGHYAFIPGNWCHVTIPSLDIDEDLFITKRDDSIDGGEWLTGLTLTNYGSSFGSGESNKVSSDDDKDKDSSSDSDSNEKSSD